MASMDTEIEEIQQAAIAAVEEVATLPPEPLAAKLADIKQMIGHYIGMTNEIETRRERHYEFTLLFIAVLVPAFALVIADRHRLGLLATWLAGGWLAVQLAFAAVSIFVYHAQSRYSYPFLKLKGVANQWKWFYYGNPAVTEIKTDSVFGPILHRKDAASSTIPYLKGLRDFASWYTAENPKSETVAALKQLYLLQVHNYYKNQWHKQLYAVSLWAWLIGIAYIAAVLIVYWAR